MARFRCAACDRVGEFVYDPTRHVCPNCGSNDVVFAQRTWDNVNFNSQFVINI
jgi:predicted RNA-binding Zn-ribbon protein involved in translation (DUF1610 family)